MREWPLALILTLRFALVALVSVAALSVIVGLYIVPRVKQKVEEHHHGISAAMVSQVESYFSVADRELRALSVLLASRSRDRYINDLLDNYVSASSFYEAIYLSDEAGRVEAIGLPVTSRAMRQNQIGLDVSNRDFVREARQLNFPTWSNSFLSPISLRLTIAIAIPVGKRVLIGEVAMTPLPELTRKLTKGSELIVMLLDRQNQLVAHSSDAHANQQMGMGHLGIVAGARQQTTPIQTHFILDGRDMVGSAWPIPGLDWLVVVMQPHRIAYAEIDAIWQRFLFSILVAIIGALAAAIWTARVLSRRFESYNLQADKIAHGRYDLVWDESRIKEFNALRNNLEDMATAIQERERGMRQAQAAMQELNATLEERVDERTDELTRANEELVNTLETLTRAQNELLHTEKLASLGSMVAGIAHELNTPIGNAVMVASTLADHNRELLREAETGTLRRSSLEQHLNQHHTATDILLRNLHRAAELIRSFKQVAVDQTSAQRRKFVLDEVVGEITLALHPMLKKTPFVVETEIAPDLWLDSYPGPLGQVLTNLINNSVLHGFEGRSSGTITIIGKAAGDEYIELRISDDGRGIPADHQDKIFDPFFTTRLGRGGSGLGLNIVHSLVSRVLGGSITVCSDHESGTEFRIRLPRSAPQTGVSV